MHIKQSLTSSTRILTYGNKYCQNESLANSRKIKPFQVKVENKETNWSNRKNYYKRLSNDDEAFKVLDLVGIRDDFYLNTVDWSSTGQLGIGIDHEVYLYTPQETVQLCKVIDGSYVSSIKFKEQTFCVGFSDGRVKIYDLQTRYLIREIFEHQKRVSALEFSENNILFTGSKDKSILVNDLRIRESVINQYSYHRGEICSLKMENYCGNYLASGSNDNHIGIWDLRRNQQYLKYTEHKGAVKAIAWCPWKNGIIASAGGAGDKTIRIWNVNEKLDLAYKKTGAQVSSLIWSQQTGTLISSHGHSDNQINFWEPELISNQALSLEKVRTLSGHQGRILNTCLSPNGHSLCSLSADQSLRFWKIIDSKQDPWKAKQLNYTVRESMKLK